MPTPRRTAETIALWVERVRECGTIAAASVKYATPDPTVRAIIQDGRRRALQGEVSAPPLPAAAVPPPGFIVHQNSGAYDAHGALLRQWVGTKRDAGEAFEVPLGHVIKGESALVDPDGRVLVRWVKTKEGAGAGLVDALQAVFRDYDGRAAVIPAPSLADDDLLTVYPMPDLHLGMYAWGAETGESYDVPTAVAVATDGLQALVDQSRPSRRAVILGLGDYFHANDEKAATPGSGHRLDVDGRWQKVFGAGAKLATLMVDIVARKHAEVEVVFLPGNHDPDAAVCLTVALALFYSATSRITVNQSPGIAWYLRHGRVLLGATHGHTMPMDRMAMMMATDQAEAWGQTSFRAIYSGHIHHRRVQEFPGVTVESFPSPAARDAYNAGAGYRAGRSLHAITYHREAGETGRHRVNIQVAKRTP